MSTLLDAIRFALYGTSSAKAPPSLLHKDAPQPDARMEVELTLLVDDSKEALVRRFVDFEFIAGKWEHLVRVFNASNHPPNPREMPRLAALLPDTIPPGTTVSAESLARWRNGSRSTPKLEAAVPETFQAEASRMDRP